MVLSLFQSRKKRLGDAESQDGRVKRAMSLKREYMVPHRTSSSTVPVRQQVSLQQYRSMGHSLFSVYHLLFTSALGGNLIAMICLVLRRNIGTGAGASSAFTILNHAASAAAANLMIAVLIRQDYIVNMMYFICRMVPLGAPSRLRHTLALVYEHGGLHSGCAVSSTSWLIFFTVCLSIEQVTGRFNSLVVLLIDCCLLMLLLAIIVTSVPQFRARHHNLFELVHRFVGWTALALFWVELILFINVESESATTATTTLGFALATTPAFWMLLITSLHIIYPWLFLRKVQFTSEKLSNNAIQLRHQKPLPPFRGIAISESPLREWHPFASFPDKDGAGGSLIISKAGDWTHKTVEKPRPYYYTKGLSKTGVLAMATIFRRVVVVTTGSGIGPCLGILMDMQTPCRVIWSAPSPALVYGAEIVGKVRAIDERAIIHDTKLHGRPNLVDTAAREYVSIGAEAVFCISNKELTRQIIFGLRSRGVPAFGPIWDS